jgi:hypothetical protein
MRQLFTVIALFASVALHGPAFARGEPLENIPLKWTPTSSLASMGALDLSGATIATKIRFDALVDARRNTSLIAENREEADKIRPVTTSSDVGAFVVLRAAYNLLANGAFREALGKR